LQRGWPDAVGRGEHLHVLGHTRHGRQRQPPEGRVGFHVFFLGEGEGVGHLGAVRSLPRPQERRAESGRHLVRVQATLAGTLASPHLDHPSWWENQTASQRGCRVRMAGSTHLKPDGQALLGAVVDEHTLLGFVAEEALDAVPHLLERACQIAAVHLQVRPATRSSDQVPGIRTESGPRTCKARQPASQPASQRFSCHAQDAALPRLL